MSITETERRIPADPFQRRCEAILFWAVIGLAELHMFACSFREVLPGYSKPFFRYERWIGAAILGALVIYLVVSAIRYPGTHRRIKHLCRKLCSLEQIYMVWMFVWYIVVVAFWQHLRDGHLFKANDWWLFEQVLMSFVFFPLPRILGSERSKKLIEPMIKLILIPHMIVWAWILYQYFHKNFLFFPSGGQLHVDGVLSLSFGYNPNITGAGALIMMSLCLYFIATQKTWQKLPYIFGSSVYFFILVLTNCRTSWYCVLLIATGGSFLIIWFSLKEKHWFLRLSVGFLTAGFCVLLLIWLRGELFVLHDAIFYYKGNTNPAYAAIANEVVLQRNMPSTLKMHTYSEPFVLNTHSITLTANTSTAADVARTLEDDTGDLTGRVPLYKACLDVMFSRKLIFFFGVPSLDIGSAVYGRYGIDHHYVHAHNFLLTTGMSYGVPTMFFAAVFLVSVFVRCFRVLFLNKKQMFQGFWMIPVILLALAAEDMMESFLNLSAWSLTCTTFYLFAGWIVAMDKEARETKLKVERRENKVERPGDQSCSCDA